MFILICIGIIGFGFLLKIYYKNGFFHNSIYIPVIILGFVLLIFTIIGVIQNINVTSIFELNIKDVKSIEVISTYNYDIGPLPYNLSQDAIKSFLDELKNSRQIENYENTSWYLDIKITLWSGEELFVLVSKKESHFEFNQVYMYLFLPVSDKNYKVSENIELLFQ